MKTITNKQITREEFIRRASSHFLCEPLPEGFWDWPEEDIDEFINENKTCWFNNCEVNELYDIIEGLANELKHLHEHGGFKFEL